MKDPGERIDFFRKQISREEKEWTRTKLFEFLLIQKRITYRSKNQLEGERVCEVLEKVGMMGN